MFKYLQKNRHMLLVSKMDGKIVLLMIFTCVILCIILILTLKFYSNSPFSTSLVSVSRAPTTSSITATFMFHNFFLALCYDLSTFFFKIKLSFIFTLSSTGTDQSTCCLLFFFLVKYSVCLYISSDFQNYPKYSSHFNNNVVRMISSSLRQFSSFVNFDSMALITISLTINFIFSMHFFRSQFSSRFF